nr:WAT1-related protein At5g07050-like isoform X2 [Setaria viridis]
MRPYMLLAYRNLIGAAAVAPLTLIFERDVTRKMPNLVQWGWISLNATFGIILAMGLYYYGLHSTNATYSVIFLNLIPVMTSLIAITLRVENLILTSWCGRMKLLGILTCVGGMMMVRLYKGKLVHHPWPTHLLKSQFHAATSPTHHHNMVRLAKVFPFRYWATTLTCLSGSLQAFVIGILIDSKKSAWTLKWDLQLLTVIYSGVFTTSVAFMLMSWAVKRRGPIYPPMFNSLAMIATVVMDSVLLDTNIFLGSILGTLLVILGLYTFLLGKGKELQHAAAAQKANQKQYTSNGEQGGHELQLRHGDEIA